MNPRRERKILLRRTMPRILTSPMQFTPRFRAFRLRLDLERLGLETVHSCKAEKSGECRGYGNRSRKNHGSCGD
jgi:hypothetical protein